MISSQSDAIGCNYCENADGIAVAILLFSVILSVSLYFVCAEINILDLCHEAERGQALQWMNSSLVENPSRFIPASLKLLHDEYL